MDIERDTKTEQTLKKMDCLEEGALENTKPRARTADSLSPPEYEKSAKSGHFKSLDESVPFSTDSLNSGDESDASDIPSKQQSP